MQCGVASVVWSLLLSPYVSAQQPAAAQDQDQTGMVQLNFPEQVELKLVVDYISERLGIKILYDEQLQNKPISILARQPIPAESLLGLLESALKMKGLAMVDASTPGWKRIVASTDLSQIARPTDQPLEAIPPTTAVTQAFELKHVPPERLSQLIQPFLTKPGANTITVPDQNLLIVTDYADNLMKLTQLIESIDRAGPETILEFYSVNNVEAAALAQQISQALAARPAVQGVPRVQLNHDERTNQLLIIATRPQLDEVLQLARAIDVPLGMTTQVYVFRYVSADRIDTLVKELFDQLTIKRLYRSAVDAEDNLLVATATPQIHERIAWLRTQMDVASKAPGSAVKFFRLKHAKAQEVLATIQAIEQGGQQPRYDYLRGVSALGRGRVGTGVFRGTPFSQQEGAFVPGPNRPAIPGAEPVLTPAFQAPTIDGGQPPGVLPSGVQPTAATEPGQVGLVPSMARVTADATSNTIIVMGDRAAQQMYADLIEYLDRRPPQVMIEARVVILDTSQDYSLGVEVSFGDRIGLKKMFQFTSYGLSAVDPVTGALALIPGRGLNWTLVDPEEADAVLRALASHRRARVTSAPRILVNDNSTGTLASVQEVPFTSVNASNTVATTSFAGFAEAGTTIEVTPRISDDDHLQLDYVVSLNSFTGDGSAGVPPPRQTDEVASSVTIPDGFTIIAGGLNRRNMSSTYDGIPWLEDIPIIRQLTGISTADDSQTTLFVFLTPTILRDDKFRDLKYLSEVGLIDSQSPSNYPWSEPIFIK